MRQFPKSKVYKKFDKKTPQPWFRIYGPNLPYFSNMGSGQFRFLGFTVCWGAGFYDFEMPFFMIVW